MSEERALRIAHLIKHFAACMTAHTTEAHLDHAISFNELFEEHLMHEPDEGASDLAVHICHALSNTRELDADHYARVLPDLLYVLSLQLDHSLEHPNSSSHTPRIPQGLFA